MKTKIAVVGATGQLGKRVAHALLNRDAEVQALVRTSSAREEVDALKHAGVVMVLMDDMTAATKALEGTACVVSTLSGLHETIIDAQSTVLHAAIEAGVPRFIPSDFAADFTKLSPGENRNFDLRREFHTTLDVSAIQATSILNGMFADMLPTPHSPFFDFEAKRVNYWGSPDQRMDFTTMDDTAAFTAAAALDKDAPRVLRIAGDQVSAREMAAIASEVTGSAFHLFRLGTVDELAHEIVAARQSDPKAETTVFAPFQALQYTHNMASGRAKLDTIDNDRYPGLSWTKVKDLLATADEAA